MEEKNSAQAENENLNQAEWADEETPVSEEIPEIEVEIVEASESEAAPEEAGEDQAAREIADLKDQLLRLRAEFDNYRRRSLKEQEKIRATASENLIREILPVVDNLERALQSAPDMDSPLVQGVDMVLRMFRDVLQAKGLEPVPGVGEPFDPNWHEALAQQPSDEIPADHVAIEFERGYRMNGYVLRHAKVVVSTGPPEGPAENPEAQASS